MDYKVLRLTQCQLYYIAHHCTKSSSELYRLTPNVFQFSVIKVNSGGGGGSATRLSGEISFSGLVECV